MVDNKKEQFSQIYDQYIEKIYRFVYIKVNSEEIAQDITSKVFLKGWESFDQIQNTGAFLYQIARNAVIDYYREKAKNQVISAELVPQILDKKSDLYQKAILSSDIQLVKSAIQSLKQDYQDIIIWHYLDDMPITNIAQLIDKPAGTVRVMLHRGLKDLKDIIKEV